MMYVHASNPFFDGGVCVVFTFRIASMAYTQRCAMTSVNELAESGTGEFVKCSIAEIEAS